MICPNCNTEIENGAKFCTHCGISLLTPKEEKDSKYSGVLLTFILVVFMLSLFRFVFQLIESDWYSSLAWRILLGIVDIIQTLAWLLIPFAIKKTSIKGISFVLIGILECWWLYNTIHWLIVTWTY